MPGYFIGDIIELPTQTFQDSESRDISLRREPVRASEAPFKYRLEGDAPGTFRQFDPATEVDERFHYSPHARFPVVANEAGDLEVIGDEGDPEEDGFVYASVAGLAQVYFRTEADLETTGGEGIFGLVRRDVLVAGGSRLPVRTIYWTELPFDGPGIEVPQGEIEEVVFAYTDEIPVTVPLEEAYQANPENPLDPTDPTEAGQIEDQTIWFDFNGTQRTILAYNREGRILVELLGEQRSVSGPLLRRQVGIEVVDIVRDARPVRVDVPVGERLYPLTPLEEDAQSYPLPVGEIARQTALSRISDNLLTYSPSQVPNTNFDPVLGFFTELFTVNGEPAYYARRATESVSDVLIYWAEEGAGGLRWPAFLNRYNQYWPDDLGDYVVNVRPSDDDTISTTLPIFGATSAVELVHQDDPTRNQAGLNDELGFEVILDPSDPVNRSLLLLRSGEDFWFIRVESVLDTALDDPRYDGFYQETNAQGGVLTALVGDRLMPPAGADSIAGYVDLSSGDAIDMTAYVDPFGEDGISGAEAGAIIPVNAAPSKGDWATTNDQLLVWWFEKLEPPAGLDLAFEAVHFPSYFTKYQLEWPADAPTIVLASNEGSGDLNAAAAEGVIYTQNDPSMPGYNANEEHAILTAGRAYALRDDLNVAATTSSPYVLVRYTSPLDGRPEIDPFRILRTDETYDFEYEVCAGTKLRPVAPLFTLPVPMKVDVQGFESSRNEEVTSAAVDPPTFTPSGSFGEIPSYSSFTVEDRNGEKWIYRGPHDP
ncbi:MAG: hypothetical protein AAGA58_17490, partial [Verrucomicrobiota bacterium]